MVRDVWNSEIVVGFLKCIIIRSVPIFSTGDHGQVSQVSKFVNSSYKTSPEREKIRYSFRRDIEDQVQKIIRVPCRAPQSHRLYDNG